MSKKKKSSKKKNISSLQLMDDAMNETYDDLTYEIRTLQTKLYMADREAEKKIRKRKKKNKYKRGEDFKFDSDIKEIRRKAREEVLRDMEGTNLLDRVRGVLNDLVPIVVVVARLVASLILSILSLDFVKVNIKPTTLNKLNGVYQKAMSIA